MLTNVHAKETLHAQRPLRQLPGSMWGGHGFLPHSHVWKRGIRERVDLDSVALGQKVDWNRRGGEESAWPAAGGDNPGRYGWGRHAQRKRLEVQVQALQAQQGAADITSAMAMVASRLRIVCVDELDV